MFLFHSLVIQNIRALHYLIRCNQLQSLYYIYLI